MTYIPNAPLPLKPDCEMCVPELSRVSKRCYRSQFIGLQAFSSRWSPCPGTFGAAYARSLFGLAVLLMAGAQSISLAGDKSQKTSPPPIEISTNLVVVRAVFVGSRGRRITNLTADDITVNDSGKLQKLLIFEGPSNGEKGRSALSPERFAKEPTPASGQSQEVLHVLILMPGMGWVDRHYALQAVAKYLESEHDGRTKVAVADASGAALPFTSEAGEMKDFARSLIKLSIPPVGFESWRFGQSAVRLCQSMKGIGGRKAIVLFSDFYRNPYSLGTQPDELVPMALNIGAAVYAADARGVMTVTPLGDASSENVILDPGGQDFLLMDQQIRLTSLSSETGGEYVPGNDLGAVFKEVERDSSSSYLLGYYNSELKHDGAFHSIKIALNRPGIHVRARKGYFAPILGINDLDPNSQLRLALASEYPFRDVRIKFRPYFFPGVGPEGSFSITSVSVEFRWASGTDESLAASPLSIVGTIRASPNHVEDFSGDAVPRVLAELGTPTQYYLESAIHSPALKLPSGDTTIKVAARTATGQLGNGVLRFTVPDQQTKGVRISSLVISSQAETVKASDQHGGLSDPLIAGDIQIVPSASNQFEAGKELFLFARVLGDDDARPFSAILSVKAVSGATIVTPIARDLNDAGDGSRFGVPVLFRLPAPPFARVNGPFVAALTIKEKGGKEVGTASAVFAVSRENESIGTHPEP